MALLAMVSAVAASIAGMLIVHSLLAARASDFRSRSLLYAYTIASSLPPLIGTEGTPDLAPFADYARFSGLLYAQVVSGDSLLLATSFADGGAYAPGPSSRITRLPSVTELRIAGHLVIDIAFPYGPIYSEDRTQGPFSTGFVRLGIDGADLDRHARRIMTQAAASGAIAWCLSVGSGVLVLRKRGAQRRGPHVSGTPSAASAGRARTCGSLTLYFDEARLDVAGQSIGLTPKLRDVLWVLFSEPGRTFSDAEILTAVWRDSPYADSRDVKQHVYLIRKRLLAAGLPADKIVANVPGLGYRVVSHATDRPVDAPFDERSIHG